MMTTATRREVSIDLAKQKLYLSPIQPMHLHKDALSQLLPIFSLVYRTLYTPVPPAPPVSYSIACAATMLIFHLFLPSTPCCKPAHHTLLVPTLSCASQSRLDPIPMQTCLLFHRVLDTTFCIRSPSLRVYPCTVSIASHPTKLRLRLGNVGDGRHCGLPSALVRHLTRHPLCTRRPTKQLPFIAVV